MGDGAPGRLLPAWSWPRLDSIRAIAPFAKLTSVERRYRAGGTDVVALDRVDLVRPAIAP